MEPVKTFDLIVNGLLEPATNAGYPYVVPSVISVAPSYQLIDLAEVIMSVPEPDLNSDGVNTMFEDA